MATQAKNILLVEDNSDHAELALSSLQGFYKQHEQKYQISVVRTGRECIQSIIRKTFDVVVMDYSLPKMNGLELLESIRKRGVNTPVVMVTGRGDEKIAAEAIKKGASEYLVKDQGYLERLPWAVHSSLEQYERKQEKKRLEAELEKYQIELEMSKRLASIGEMASRIAHEIKNPLSKIKIGMDFFKKSLPGLNNQDNQVVEGILDGVKNLNKIATELLNYAKPPIPAFRHLDIQKILEASLSDLAEHIQRLNIRVVRRFYCHDAVLKVDGVKLKEVFLNIIGNALEAMLTGGTLRIKTCWQEREEGRFMEISFTDTGEGIPEENLEKVFAPFYTTKPTGTGLVLSVVKKIMEIHGGHLNIQSHIGKGTTVTLWIPDNKKD